MSKETSYYVSSFQDSSKNYASRIRKHWGIENRSHYVKDVTLLEDSSRIRKNPENMALLRSWALNLLRKKKVKNVANTIYSNALDINKAISFIT